MVNEKYFAAARTLADINKELINTEKSPREREKDTLFYWLMSRLQWEIQSCYPPKNFHLLIIKEQASYYKDVVLLGHGSIANYISQYVKREQFKEVVKDVKKIFDEIEEKRNKEFCYHMTISLNPKIEITIHMVV